MDRLKNVIRKSQMELYDILESHSKTQGKFSLDQYVRYLSMQYNLVIGVQKQFLRIAAHEDLFLCKKLIFLFSSG